MFYKLDNIQPSPEAAAEAQALVEHYGVKSTTSRLVQLLSDTSAGIVKDIKRATPKPSPDDPKPTPPIDPAPYRKLALPTEEDTLAEAVGAIDGVTITGNPHDVVRAVRSALEGAGYKLTKT